MYTKFEACVNKIAKTISTCTTLEHFFGTGKLVYLFCRNHEKRMHDYKVRSAMIKLQLLYHEKLAAFRAGIKVQSDIITCCNCGHIQTAVIEHTFPFTTFIKQYDKCYYVIMESEWNSLITTKFPYQPFSISASIGATQIVDLKIKK